ncbi:rhodanese-like protein (plasmid) [Cupriavidus necator N-1]|uniref:Rhodanese-like protein n=1 Tax=Cupriavidus necator (strain ATCC 43291 / DSM 13513 / CCUG 52238 / LMG 8453 / N-1) TaxID=1042878 RepID=F8GVW9_CUPNN|nr:rhodanese-like domain-containing protein [Cupriavidus necator]AEI81611.1 rhodanese-like protein [Cupriavidus necator N-1]MDX6007976.1 rhodanese-like domain-containing protein [Cupriavidus necator]
MSQASYTAADAVTLKGWLHDADEIALFDVREHGQYGEGHPFYAVPLPYSRLELDIGRLAPRTDARMVLADDGDGVAQAAAAALARLGYTNLFVLDGGMPAWQAAGYALFAGVNVPSKTFGELAEHHYRTPRVTAQELAAMQAGANAPVVLDGRPTGEFRKMNIPGAISCPNGELAYRLRDLVPDSTTPIVINCAGRTRSIIGAQSLINFGVSNPVYALENGTQGWYLNDFTLEHGGTARYPENASPRELDAARNAAQALAARFDVPRIAAAQAIAWLADRSRTTFLCDVRTPEEYATQTLPGAQHTPGGQLMQATDQYVGVRRARLVLFDAEGVRAIVVASWLRQMGHDAVVLDGGLQAGLAAGVKAAHGPAYQVTTPAIINVAQLAAGMATQSMLALDLRGSMTYRAGQIAGSYWSTRARLAQDLRGVPHDTTLVLIGDADGDDPADLAFADLHTLGYRDVRRLHGGFGAWRDAGHAVSRGAQTLPDARCIDYLFFVHDRHDGNKAAARQYLAWETGLIGQLDAQELATFRFKPLD